MSDEEEVSDPVDELEEEEEDEDEGSISLNDDNASVSAEKILAKVMNSTNKILVANGLVLKNGHEEQVADVLVNMIHDHYNDLEEEMDSDYDPEEGSVGLEPEPEAQEPEEEEDTASFSDEEEEVQKPKKQKK